MFYDTDSDLAIRSFHHSSPPHCPLTTTEVISNEVNDLSVVLKPTVPVVPDAVVCDRVQNLELVLRPQQPIVPEAVCNDQRQRLHLVLPEATGHSQRQERRGYERGKGGEKEKPRHPTDY